MGPGRYFRSVGACVAALVVVIIGATPADAAMLPNGSFETGDFSDWTAFATDEGNWDIYDQDDALLSNLPSPPHGEYAASTEAGGPNHKYLSQEITLPNRPMRLSFVTAWDNVAGIFCTPDSLSHESGCNQQFRVDIMEPGAPATSTAVEDILKPVYRTEVGAPAQKGAFTVRSSLRKFRGQTVVVRFAQVDNQEVLAVMIDKVKLERI